MRFVVKWRRGSADRVRRRTASIAASERGWSFDALTWWRSTCLSRPLTALLFAVTVIVMGGCATRSAVVRAEPEVLAWPAPPLPPRVKFVRLVTDPPSMGVVKRDFAETVVDFFSGKQPPRDRLYQPMEIEVSDDGQRVYIADFGQMVVFLADLQAKTLTPLPQAFERPFGLALDNDGNLYISEQDAKRITVVDPSYKSLRMITDPSLVRPAGIAIDRARRLLYVADASRQNSSDHSVKVFDLAGTLLRTVGAGRGDCEGCLMFPTFATVDAEGRVYVSNTLNGRVDVFDADGKYLKRIGERGNAFGMFDKPKGVALDTLGNLFVVDSGWSNVQIFNDKGEVLLFFGGRGSYPGLLANPTGIAIDKKNRIYVSDFLNSRVVVYDLVNAAAETVEAKDDVNSTAERSR